MTMTTSLSDRYATAMQTLDAIGQNHALNFYDRLDTSSRDRLLTQIEGIDWDEVDRLIETHVRHKPEFELPGEVKPAPWYPCDSGEKLKAKYDEAWRAGEQLLRDGAVAAFVWAAVAWGALDSIRRAGARP